MSMQSEIVMSCRGICGLLCLISGEITASISWCLLFLLFYSSVCAWLPGKLSCSCSLVLPCKQLCTESEFDLKAAASSIIRVEVNGEALWHGSWFCVCGCKPADWHGCPTHLTVLLFLAILCKLDYSNLHVDVRVRVIHLELVADAWPLVLRSHVHSSCACDTEVFVNECESHTEHWLPWVLNALWIGVHMRVDFKCSSCSDLLCPSAILCTLELLVPWFRSLLRSISVEAGAWMAYVSEHNLAEELGGEHLLRVCHPALLIAEVDGSHLVPVVHVRFFEAVLPLEDCLAYE